MLNIDRRLLRNFDWLTLGAIAAVTVIGIMTIYSATRQPGEAPQSALFMKQAIWLLVGLGGLVAFTLFDYIWLSRLSIPIYLIGLALLLAVLVIGRTGMGAQRWISLGPLSFQPSEFFKLMFIIMVANHFSYIQGRLETRKLFGTFFLIVFLPFVFLFKQPDLGTGIVVLLIFSAMVIAKGLQKKLVVLLLLIALISLPFVGNIMWTGLKDYQKNRLIAFIDPEADPSGIGYHLNQSKVAIGSGQFFGKGFLNGTQGPFRFLPERHTDFIFASFAEEWGFVGALALLGFYFFLIMRGLDTARKAKDEFGRMLALGITAMFAIYFFVNVGMTLGMMPVVGIPLPFMSYGGTALLSNFISAGVLISIRTRRFTLFY